MYPTPPSPTHLKYNNTATLVAGGEQLTVVVELDARYQVRLGHVVLEGAFHLTETPRCLPTIAWNVTCVKIFWGMG